MRQLYPGRRTLLSLLALSSLIPAFAGNIPQYTVAKGDASAKYAEFTDGTVIPCPWKGGIYALLPDGGTTPNVTTAQGFPIGFDFRFGGTTVSQFIPSNTGDIYLGKDAVTYGNGCFRISMSPVKHGLKAGEISYKVTGSEGNRVLALQWKNATIDQSSGYVGKYSVQFRLYEADGKIEVAFKEIETPDSNNGFDTSIHGWDGRDAVLLTATGLDGRISVSPNFKADMLTPSSYVKWDADDYDNGYSPVFVFTPESDTTPPASAPTDLKVTQNGDNLEISCVKAADADATVVLISGQPFTDADMPVDGETFQAAYLDSNGKQWFPTQLGNATPLTYLNDSEISTIYKGTDAGKTYYVRAISANGYPAYNRTNFAEVVFSASQAAPTSFTAEAADGRTILLNVEAENPVVIAATTVREPGYGKGYNGLFGVPSADAEAGDGIEGGGKVIYVGEPGNFRAETEANAMTYFRAWTVKDGRVSSTTADCAAAPNVSFPYEPAIEDYPQGESLLGWETLPSGTAAYIPQSRNEGTENVVKAVSANGERIILKTPDLPLDRPVRVSFEWAMETVRPPESSEDSGSIALPKGNKPGEFGSGSLDLILNGAVHGTINKYDGAMTIFSGDEYVEGSSTFVPFEAEVPRGEGTGKLEISFAGDAENTSILYLRNIRVEAIGEPVTPGAPLNLNAVYDIANNLLTITGERHADATSTLILVSERDFEGELENGRRYERGETVGNATVAYHGNDADISVLHAMDVIPSQITVTAFSTDSEGAFAPSSSVVRLTTVGVDSVTDDRSLGDAEVYNVAGMRLRVSDIGELPAGIYIVNGRKVIVKR